MKKATDNRQPTTDNRQPTTDTRQPTTDNRQPTHDNRQPTTELSHNILWTADNLPVLRGMNSESVDLIYLDPPFNSKRTYSAPIGSKAAGASFKDMWTWADIDESLLDSLVTKYPQLMNYIHTISDIYDKSMMSYCLFMAMRLIEMHRILKPTGSLYLHCDPTASHYLKIVLDTIFGKTHFRNEIVWCYSNIGVAPKSRFPRKHDILFFYEKTEKAKYITSFNGFMKPKGDRHTGYPTQKPLKLLYRIIQASSNKGDVILDPFCGCATTCVASQQLQRKWIGIDIEKQAAQVLIDRLEEDGGFIAPFIHINALDDPKKLPKRTDIPYEKPSQPIKIKLYGEQGGYCNGCKTHFEANNLEIDHIVPKSKGGSDIIDNYQLLCGRCNRIKGNRPMEYLSMKIHEREKHLRSKFSF